MNVKEKSARHFDGLAGNYEDSYAGKHSRTLYDGVMAKILMFPHDTVLDVGCGTGNLLSMLHREAGMRLCGLDLSPEMVKTATKKLGPEAEIKVGDSEHLPWADGLFAIVCCTDSFHHYPRPEKVLAEMKRVLRPEGHLIIGDALVPSPFRQMANFSFRFSKGGDHRVYSREEMITMVQRSGLQTVDWQRAGYAFILTVACV